jgi:hypothetical protein
MWRRKQCFCVKCWCSMGLKIARLHIPGDIILQLREGTFVLNLWILSTLALERLSKIMKQLNFDNLQHHRVHYIYSYVEWTGAGRGLFMYVCLTTADPIAAPSKAWVCGISLSGIEGLIPAGGMDVLWVLCVVRQWSLCLADPSSRGVLPNVMVNPR